MGNPARCGGNGLLAGKRNYEIEVFYKESMGLTGVITKVFPDSPERYYLPA